jgi:hypothetical protein
MAGLLLQSDVTPNFVAMKSLIRKLFAETSFAETRWFDLDGAESQAINSGGPEAHSDSF